MKKVYRFNLIPGVEFVEKDGFYYAASDDPIWPKSHITKVIIDGLLEYESNNRTLYSELTFVKKAVEDRDKLIEEKDKEIEELTKKLKNAERNISYLNDHIEYIKKCAKNEIDHRNKLLEENDKSIEYIRVKLHEEIIKSEAYKEANKTLKEENTKLIDLIAQSPISKSPIPLSSASDCSDLYICTPDHITYGYIAGGFGVGLYVGDALILLKGDKASEAVYDRRSMIDKINTLEETLKKKDKTIEGLRNTAEFANNICEGYSALTDTLTNGIAEKNSEIKVLSDQVTRLMDQLKEAMEENSGCDDIKPSRLTPEMVAEYEQRVEKETKPKTNFDKVMSDMHDKLSPERLVKMISEYDCDGAQCNECPFDTIVEPYGLKLCNMSIDMPDMLVGWLKENTKED